MVAVHVAQVATRLDDVPHAPLELLCLGETAVGFAVPEDLARGNGASVPALGLTLPCLGLVVDGDDEGAACGGLEGDFAEGEGKGGEELLGVLPGL